MQITNGTVSRMVKPADYESRTITLSFTVDPGDDVNTALAMLSSMCEAHARQQPGYQAAGAAVVVETAAAPPAQVAPAAAVEPTTARGRRNARPPVVETQARVEPTVVGPAPAQTEAPAANASVVPTASSGSVVPIPAAASTSSAETVPSPSVAPAGASTAPVEGDITADDLNRAIGLARKIWQVPGETIVKLRDAATGVAGMSLFVPEATQDMKRKFLAELKKLNPNEPGESY